MDEESAQYLKGYVMGKEIDLIIESAKQQVREVLTKKTLLANLADLPDSTPIRIALRLEDVARAKKADRKSKMLLEFELCDEIEITTDGALVSGWVHPERLPSEQKRITGSLLIEREVGTVKWFNDAKGLGFIVRNNGEDVFVHYEAIRGDGYRCLRTGGQVEYTLYETNKGLQAQDVVQLSVPEELEPA